jgi:hypothetical protein
MVRGNLMLIPPQELKPLQTWYIQGTGGVERNGDHSLTADVGQLLLGRFEALLTGPERDYRRKISRPSRTNFSTTQRNGRTLTW